MQMTIDIASTALRALVSDNGGPPRKVAIPATGFREGWEHDPDQAQAAITELLAEVQKTCGRQPAAVTLVSNDRDLWCGNLSTFLPLYQPVSEQTIQDLAACFYRARSPDGRVPLAVLGQRFLLDGQATANPIGQSGRQLQLEAHVVTQPEREFGLRAVFSRAGVDIAGQVPSGIAAAMGVLSPEERRYSVLVLDLGASAIHYCLFYKGVLRMSGALPGGGNLVTETLATNVRAPFPAAEQAKRQLGCALRRLVAAQRKSGIPLPGGGRRELSALEINDYVEPCMTQGLFYLKNHFQRFGLLRLLDSPVVLTGGGSRLTGLAELVSAVLEIPARCAAPACAPKDPEWAAVAGAQALAVARRGALYLV